MYISLHEGKEADAEFEESFGCVCVYTDEK